jgi:hypothetical protein
VRVVLDTPKTFRIVLTPSDLERLHGYSLEVKEVGVTFVIEVEEENESK